MNELSDEARRLLDAAARSDGPSDERVDAIGAELFRKLGAGAVALSSVKLAAAAVAPAAPAFKVGATGTLGFFLIGGTAGVGVALTAAALGVFRPSLPAPARVTTAPAESAHPRRDAGRATVPSALAPHADEVTPGPTAARPHTSVEPDVPGSRESSLSAEVERLKEIQAFLAAGDGAAALAASDRYLAEQRSGGLRDEHVAARVLALCLLGDVTRARDAARMFVTRSPASPLLPRLAHSCVADVIGKRSRPSND